ncbi:hypothetical protein [Sphingomonas ginsenosidivorax]|uniref:hypothetical protein n=1 Tax=Sphingomonas ginsenosidivorax TaxID=862135 RepID=UPI00131598E0|nr:hypothetical protein [Sphingomonas ginsenosidivorax]
MTMRLAAAFVPLLCAAPALAQGRATVKVAAIEEGPLGGFRDRLQSTLLEFGVVRLSTNSGGRDMPTPDYVVTGRVGAPDMEVSTSTAGDYCVGGTRLSASFDLRVRDARGSMVFGGVVDASAEIGSQVVGGEGGCSSMTPANVGMRRLGNALALAAARRIAFTLVPMRVAALEGGQIVLNHGGALVPLGAIVQVAANGGAPVRYRITASTAASASAAPIGAAEPVAVGAIARLIETDDPQANARRFHKVELP